MGSIFNYDNPLMSGLGRLVDLIVLNLLTILFCIPIITIGASVTACHYAALKIRRGEGHVLENFWKSFRVNLGESTVIWIVLVINVALCLRVVLFYSTSETLGSIIKGICLIALVFWLLTGCWVFPMQSKFINNIGTTIKNSFFFAFKYLLKTILMLVVNLLPIAVFLLFGFYAIPILLLVGFSVPAYLCAIQYDRKFQEVEDMILERETTEEGTN